MFKIECACCGRTGSYHTEKAADFVIICDHCFKPVDGMASVKNESKKEILKAFLHALIIGVVFTSLISGFVIFSLMQVGVTK